MQSVATLIRIKQREIDVLKRQQATLITQRDGVHARLLTLQDQLAQEVETAKSLPGMAHFFGDFAAGNREKQKKLREHLQKIEFEMEKIADQLLDRFGEMKKYEITLANHRRRKKAAQEKAEQGVMDAVALQTYQQSREEG